MGICKWKMKLKNLRDLINGGGGGSGSGGRLLEENVL